MMLRVGPGGTARTLSSAPDKPPDNAPQIYFPIGQKCAGERRLAGAFDALCRAIVALPA